MHGQKKEQEEDQAQHDGGRLVDDGRHDHNSWRRRDHCRHGRYHSYCCCDRCCGRRSKKDWRRWAYRQRRRHHRPRKRKTDNDCDHGRQVEVQRPADRPSCRSTCRRQKKRRDSSVSVCGRQAWRTPRSNECWTACEVWRRATRDDGQALRPVDWATTRRSAWRSAAAGLTSSARTHTHIETGLLR